MRSVLALSLCLPLTLAATPARPAQAPEAALARLVQDAGGLARTSRHRATGVLRFVSVEPGRLALSGATPAGRAADFLARYGAAFGIADPAAELEPTAARTDPQGHTHLSYAQVHRGLPVFAGVLRLHFDPLGRLIAVNGTVVPGIDVDPRPALSAAAAVGRARAAVGDTAGPARTPRLLIFRTGLVQGRGGVARLAYEVEVGDGAGRRDFVYVDAATGQILDRIAGIHELLTRTVHEPDFNNVVIWSEGNTLPYASGDPGNDSQVNEIIQRTKSVYDLFGNLSGGTFLSWDGASGVMHDVWNASFIPCPNATWNGTSANFCDGVAPDDVVAHEWTHAYTQSTHGLLYQWQPGALNEAYSDIFGELVDLIDGAGTDTPGAARTVGDCSTAGGAPPPSLVLSTPPAIAGGYAVAGANFNPPPPATASAPVQLVNDGNAGGGGSLTDACSALVGFTAGRIALIDRGGGCNFASKVKRAQTAGASGVIMVNYEDATFAMGGSDPSITIPAVMVTKSDGDLIKAELGATVQATISLLGATANSVRWLVAEDSAAFGGAIRDMWNPTCFGDPARVGDILYQCSPGDGGGVHTNSGVPNHTFALLVDGGTFNGQTVAAIGLTRAAHIYWRAMSVYQVPASDFADHADALEQSCADLLGVNLADPLTGAPSGQSLAPAHCTALSAAVTATELAADPPCAFAPLLAPGAPPPICEAAVFFDGFETDPTAAWTRSNSGVFAEYDPRDWAWVATLPAGRPGAGFFAIDSALIGDCAPGSDDQSGLMALTSPPIPLPAGAPRLSFWHYVATEPEFDGGNLKIAVNGGPFTLVPASSFTFNPYNSALQPPETGNTSPLAGQAAFTGADGGEVSGSWGQSQVDLAAFAAAGDTIHLRFEFSVDGCNGLDGWYVDDVQVCTGAWAAGALEPDVPLRLGRGGGNLDLSWGASCLTSDDDYEIYAGPLGAFSSHAPLLCGTGGATAASLPEPAGDTYYLVVPANAGREGSYGTDSAGTERPPGAGACRVQQVAPNCP